MSELQIIKELEKKLDFIFHRAGNPRNIFFDLAEKEATYSLNNNERSLAGCPKPNVSKSK